MFILVHVSFQMMGVWQDFVEVIGMSSAGIFRTAKMLAQQLGQRKLDLV